MHIDETTNIREKTSWIARTKQTNWDRRKNFNTHVVNLKKQNKKQEAT
jgi:hypothetical protein